MKITRTSQVYESFRTKSVSGMFDVPEQREISHTWDAQLPIDTKPWRIGLIVGPSGSGKTSIASEVFKDCYVSGFDWPAKQSMLDGFDAHLSVKDIVECLSSVGLSSPPHWLKPYAHLSTGQRFRADLARACLSGKSRIAIDEFTSVVDRDVAKVCCAALAKTLRRRKEPQLVAISCHFDIIDWLQPDWIFDVAALDFKWRRLRQRPGIKLCICESDVRAWKVFKGHHYLSADIHKASACYTAFWQDKPVAFTAVLHFPHPRVRNFKREHRTVVLPDYQGVGIGNAMSETIAQHYTQHGYRYISLTSHPSMIWHRQRSALWAATRVSGRANAVGRTAATATKNKVSRDRLSVAWEYVG